jgi:hypothetical protein
MHLLGEFVSRTNLNFSVRGGIAIHGKYIFTCQTKSFFTVDTRRESCITTRLHSSLLFIASVLVAETKLQSETSGYLYTLVGVSKDGERLFVWMVSLLWDASVDLTNEVHTLLAIDRNGSFLSFF